MRCRELGPAGAKDKLGDHRPAPDLAMSRVDLDVNKINTICGDGVSDQAVKTCVVYLEGQLQYNNDHELPGCCRRVGQSCHSLDC
jgi:hypothetical protein